MSEGVRVNIPIPCRIHHYITSHTSHHKQAPDIFHPNVFFIVRCLSISPPPAQPIPRIPYRRGAKHNTSKACFTPAPWKRNVKVPANNEMPSKSSRDRCPPSSPVQTHSIHLNRDSSPGTCHTVSKEENVRSRTIVVVVIVVVVVSSPSWFLRDATTRHTPDT